jgi:peptidylprolyl isomerase
MRWTRLMLAAALSTSALLAACGDDAPDPAADAVDQSSKDGDTTPTDYAKAPSDVAAPPSDATKTDSGLAYKIIQSGKGEQPSGATSKVTVHYTGWTT